MILDKKNLFIKQGYYIVKIKKVKIWYEPQKVECKKKDILLFLV